MLTELMGKKLGMTRIFADDGQWIPVTVLEAGPCTVIQRKTQMSDGYEAVQLGFGDIKEKHCTKPLMGHFKKSGVAPKRTLREVRVDSTAEFKPGDEVRADIFQPGDCPLVVGKVVAAHENRDGRVRRLFNVGKNYTLTGVKALRR